MSDIAFLFVGLATGLVGTLVGIGGGFLLVPIFIFLFPTMEPSRITLLSLLAVAANSLSGTIGYSIRKSIHWPSVFLFGLAGLPGVYLGVHLSQIISRDFFELIFAWLLLSVSIFLFARSFRLRFEAADRQFWNRKAMLIGFLSSFFVGVISSLFGIGGGIIHVPLLSQFLHYPIHLATGTSQSILAITSTTAVLIHFFEGGLERLESFIPYLLVGLVVGAQGGAALSKLIHWRWILRLLSVALFSVGLRLLFKNY